VIVRFVGIGGLLTIIRSHKLVTVDVCHITLTCNSSSDEIKYKNLSVFYFFLNDIFTSFQWDREQPTKTSFLKSSEVICNPYLCTLVSNSPKIPFILRMKSFTILQKR
jgi:hypothetical protein